MESLFDISGRVAVVTGGYGVLGSSMAKALAKAGAHLVILGRNGSKASRFAESLAADYGVEAMGVAADVTNRESVADAADLVNKRFDGLDILVNGAGGNRPAATIGPDDSVFQADLEAFSDVISLNLMGTVIPSVEFGRLMAHTGKGSIVNISSVAAETPVSRVGGYGAAKASVDHFTRWLAVELASKHGGGLRVNAIRPGFFIADQNRALLLEADGTPTKRGKTILSHTPMGRFGEPEELTGALLWLVSDASRFVTGTVVTVDGGFGAQRGV
ncbi:MAG: NAD(P)-dependent dehydrogenase (short-subunit alcohol dehydrogenase family) [Rhodothermales bacterium]|jgi:NAD(P)-dependent dehydrogenase (short-subunit alcohol dehydrogenase family)